MSRALARVRMHVSAMDHVALVRRLKRAAEVSRLGLQDSCYVSDLDDFSVEVSLALMHRHSFDAAVWAAVAVIREGRAPASVSLPDGSEVTVGGIRDLEAGAASHTRLIAFSERPALSRQEEGRCEWHQPIVVVDDNPGDMLLAEEAALGAGLTGPWIGLESGKALLSYLGTASRGERPAPRLVLLDQNMPGLCGLDVLERIQSDPSLQAPPIWLLTSSTSPREASRALALGAARFLTKPQTYVEFVALLRPLGQGLASNG